MMGKCGWNGRKGWDKDMEQEKLYVIEEKTYEAHIDEEVHLYGLLHQLAFLAGKIKDRRDMENLIDTARRYGEIADQMFDRWSIPGRYLAFGDKADLARLKALELCGRHLGMFKDNPEGNAPVTVVINYDYGGED